jgi:hypothetical protein
VTLTVGGVGVSSATFCISLADPRSTQPPPACHIVVVVALSYKTRKEPCEIFAPAWSCLRCALQVATTSIDTSRYSCQFLSWLRPFTTSPIRSHVICWFSYRSASYHAARFDRARRSSWYMVSNICLLMSQASLYVEVLMTRIPWSRRLGLGAMK